MMTGGKERFMAQINVTPFVDVMLVLLIIFMVTAPMMVQGVNVDLPEATADPIAGEQDNLIVTVDRNGDVFINNYKLGSESLAEKLNKILENRTSRNVYLRADKAVAYGEVVRVMADIKKAGVTTLGMVTLPEDSDANRSN